MKLVNGLVGTVSGITTIGSLKCNIVEVGAKETVVKLTQGLRAGKQATVLNSQITILDTIENQIQYNTETLSNMLIDNNFDVEISYFGECNYIAVETFTYMVNICVHESGYSVDTRNQNRTEYGIYESEDKNHRDIKKAKTVLKYVEKFDK